MTINKVANLIFEEFPIKNRDNFFDIKMNVSKILDEFETQIRQDQKEKDVESFSKSGFTLRTKSCISKLIMDANK